MMWQEFEELAGYEVSYETYSKIIEPMYLAIPESVSKTDFIKMLNRKALEKKYEPTIRKMLTRDRSGYRKTPNGCYYHIQYVDMVGVDIRTGKIIVKPLEPEVLERIYLGGHSLDLGYEYDFDYTECVDTKKKPIVLEWMF